MPSRTQSMIRRDINRLQSTIERHQGESKALAAIYSTVSSAADLVNRNWQRYQAAVVEGTRERSERDVSVQDLSNWIQRWRPVLLLLVPGASSNIRQLPARGVTPDDVLHVAEDMVEFINTNTAAEVFREEALEMLGDKLQSAQKETVEATAALPAETSARQAFSEACGAANDVLVRGTEIIRAIFGRTSPEYKQFIARSSSKEEQEIDEVALTGELA